MVNSQTTSFRAIDLPACEEHNSVQLWFFNEDLMHQYLLTTGRGYASKDGSIKDRDGETIGKWFYVELNTPHNKVEEECRKNLENPGSGTVVVLQPKLPVMFTGEQLDDLGLCSLCGSTDDHNGNCQDGWKSDGAADFAEATQNHKDMYDNYPRE